MKRYSFAWVTAALFLLTLAGHWVFGWFAFVSEQKEHGQSIEVSQYAIQMARDTLENWQSEFLQLIWQVAGLAYLMYVGSPASKGDDERIEAKLDHLLRSMDREDGERLISRLDLKYPGREPA